jgi:phosphoribosylglycinamide formyltransferase-1
MLRIAVFASGNGTNTENIIQYFENSSTARVVLVLSNNKNAKVLERAKRLKVNAIHFVERDMYKSNKLLNLLIAEIDFIVLAGFLWRIPKSFITTFKNRIINIHPALLPKYGGKGMYGIRVHQAVKNNNEKETGITIHYVDENYDEGLIIFQKAIEVKIDDSPEQIANRVHELEYFYFPSIIDKVLNEIINTSL